MARPDFEDSTAIPIEGVDWGMNDSETIEDRKDVFPNSEDESDGSYDGDILYHKQKNIYLTGNNNTVHIHM